MKLLAALFAPLLLASSAAVTNAALPAETFSGDVTFYDVSVGLTSCGGSYSNSDYVAAVAIGLMDKAVMCGAKAEVCAKDKCIAVTVVDSCAGCARDHIDITPSAFTQLYDESVGRAPVTWRFIGAGGASAPASAPAKASASWSQVEQVPSSSSSIPSPTSAAAAVTTEASSSAAPTSTQTSSSSATSATPSSSSSSSTSEAASSPTPTAASSTSSTSTATATPSLLPTRDINSLRNPRRSRGVCLLAGTRKLFQRSRMF